jgi:hypothetical protein
LYGMRESMPEESLMSTKFQFDVLAYDDMFPTTDRQLTCFLLPLTSIVVSRGMLSAWY